MSGLFWALLAVMLYTGYIVAMWVLTKQAVRRVRWYRIFGRKVKNKMTKKELLIRLKNLGPISDEQRTKLPAHLSGIAKFKLSVLDILAVLGAEHN